MSSTNAGGGGSVDIHVGICRLTLQNAEEIRRRLGWKDPSSGQASKGLAEKLPQIY
jgi:hypothetical protein